ncbi:hypothetical protein U1Q18_002377, partial [Sarracenia purpurea var. burkii]
MMNQRWLEQLFTPCGNISEVFIPQKRSLGVLRLPNALTSKLRIPNGIGVPVQNQWGVMREDKLRIPYRNMYTVEAMEIDENWLKFCVIGNVKEHISMDSIQKLM